MLINYSQETHEPVRVCAYETSAEASDATNEASASSRRIARTRSALAGGAQCIAVAITTLLAVSAKAQTPPAPSAPVPITITSTMPADIPGGAPNATLSQAAAFAWQEFIALNWPAVPQTGVQGNRETADASKSFTDPSYTGPLVWHTFRAKVEIFPGAGNPAGTTEATPGSPQLKNLGTAQSPYYGYDAPPAYNYQTSGPIPPASGTPSTSTPWINLDEVTQIGLDQIYAGAGAGNTSGPGNQILFLAKGSRAEFDYLAPLGWWAGGAPFAATKAYIQQNLASPPPGSTSLVSFPTGTIELKAAWRKLAPNEDASRFYTTTARYYVSNSSGTIQYVDDTFALIALHIIHKTPTAPYFVFATFEQADNITDINGNPVEDEDGRFIGAPAATAFSPEIVSRNATPGGFQTFSPTQSEVRAPLGQLYYQNLPDQGLAEGTILVNRRKHPILRDVVLANQAAHRAIAAYVQASTSPNSGSPWLYYKLVNVQSAPIAGKIPGQDYTKADAATFYQANSVVETDYNLQVFSGRFYPGSYASLANTITDFNADGTPFVNVAHGGHGFNMGGCMGCHGNAQQGGGDFSFILLGGRVAAPDPAPGGNGGVVAAVLGLNGSGGASGSLSTTRPVAKAPSSMKPTTKYPLKP